MSFAVAEGVARAYDVAREARHVNMAVHGVVEDLVERFLDAVARRRRLPSGRRKREREGHAPCHCVHRPASLPRLPGRARRSSPFGSGCERRSVRAMHPALPRGDAREALVHLARPAAPQPTRRRRQGALFCNDGDNDDPGQTEETRALCRP